MPTRFAYFLLSVMLLVTVSGWAEDFPPEDFPPEVSPEDYGYDPEDEGYPNEDDDYESDYREEQDYEEYEDRRLQPKRMRRERPRDDRRNDDRRNDERRYEERRDRRDSREQPPRRRRRRPPEERTVSHIGLYGGLSNLGNGIASVDADRDLVGLKQLLLVGIAGGMRFEKYLGFEVDAFYSFTPLQEVVFQTTNQVENRTIVQFGTMLGGNFYYPLPGRTILWLPKAMMGFGFFSIQQDIEASTGTVVSEVQANGLYLGLGVDVLVSPVFQASLDFAFGVAAGGTADAGTGGAASTATNFGFGRIRLKADVRVLHSKRRYEEGTSLWIGGMFITRSMETPLTSTTNSLGGDESASQFLLSTTVQF